MRGSFGRVSAKQRIARSAAYVTVVVVACGAALYGLALLGLTTLETPPKDSVAGNAVGGLAVTAGADGTGGIWRGGKQIATARGHDGPLARADLVASGTALMTASIDGSLRITNVAAAEEANRLTLPWTADALWEGLGEPYGVPLSRWALSAVMQVLPLEIPTHLRGRRGRIFKDCPTCPQMVEIGTGVAFIGSPLVEWDRSWDEGPRQPVTMNRPFAVGCFEVTFADWTACVNDNGCNDSPGGPRSAGQPGEPASARSPAVPATNPPPADVGAGELAVVNVSWVDAKAYVAWLSKKTGKEYRLLSEVEWEYAARAGTVTRYSWGDAMTAQTSATLDGVPVTGRRNAFGLFDMNGGVSEWTEDVYRERYSQDLSKEPLWVDATGQFRVVRGSGSNIADPKRAAARGRYLENIRLQSIGFRVARNLEP